MIEKQMEREETDVVVRAHMARGLHLTTDFSDEQVNHIKLTLKSLKQPMRLPWWQLLDTEDGQAKIRINLYKTPDRIYTANCVRLVSSNHFSSEGIVHMLNGVMKPAVKTIAQLLEEEPHFSSFRERQFHSFIHSFIHIQFL